MLTKHAEGEAVGQQENPSPSPEEQKKLQQQEKKKNNKAKASKNRKELKKENKEVKRRIFPLWLRIIVVLVLCGSALLLGLMFGYGVIGDGNATDALKIDTWKHIIELVKGEK